MSRKYALVSIAALIVLSLVALSLQSSPASAQGEATATATATATDDFPVWMEVTGTIQSITQQSNSVYILLLDDGTSLLVNPATDLGGSTLTVGQTVDIMASMDEEDDTLVAKTVSVTLDATAEPTEAATAAPTEEATAEATAEPTAAATQEGTAEATCGGNGGQQPVAARLADSFGVSYDEIMAWHCQGYGFGEIARAYLLAKNSKDGLTVDQIMADRKGGKGWGQIVKDAGVDPKELAPGSVIKGKHDGSQTSGTDDTNGKGNGKGNGGNGGKGNGKGNDKGNGGKGKGGKD